MSPKLISFMLVIAAGIICASATEIKRDEKALKELNAGRLQLEGKHLFSILSFYKEVQDRFIKYVIHGFNGAVEGSEKVFNQTAWAFKNEAKGAAKEGQDAISVAQDLKIVDLLKVLFPETQLDAGEVKSSGSLVGNVANGEATATLTLSSDGTSVTISVAVTGLEIKADLSGLAAAGSQVPAAVLEQIQNTLRDSTIAAIEKELSDLVKRNLEKNLGTISKAAGIMKTKDLAKLPSLIPLASKHQPQPQ